MSSMSSPSHRILDHPADVGLEASGPDVSSAFSEAVAALAQILAGEADGLEATDTRRVAYTAADDEAALVVLLEECLFLFDARSWLALRAEIAFPAPGQVEALLTGLYIGEPEALGGTAVKAVTWHQLSVTRRRAGVTVRVFLDI
jgi:SHS2 domain-containing protein